MLLGVAMTLKGKDETVYVEYHQCDKCLAEYRLYLRSPKTVEDAFQGLAKMMANKPDREDLCFNCQNQVIADQAMLPIEV